MSAQENARLAQTVYDAFNKNEFDRALTFVAEDAEVIITGFGQTLHGHEGFRQMMQQHKAGLPDGTVAIKSQLAGEDGVTNECVYSGTHSRPLPTPGGEIPATGKAVTLPFCEVWRMRDGKVASLHNYADTAMLLQQIGVLPQPQEATV